jgi:hypothetical protein
VGVQLKGAGPTPYSRTADGLATNPDAPCCPAAHDGVNLFFLFICNDKEMIYLKTYTFKK